MRKIDIIIPVYKPDQKFLALVDKLEHQTVAVNKIIIMNTERQYFDRLGKSNVIRENLIIPERGVKNRQRMWKNWE